MIKRDYENWKLFHVSALTFQPLFVQSLEEKRDKNIEFRTAWFPWQCMAVTKLVYLGFDLPVWLPVLPCGCETFCRLQSGKRNTSRLPYWAHFYKPTPSSSERVLMGLFSPALATFSVDLIWEQLKISSESTVCDKTNFLSSQIRVLVNLKCHVTRVGSTAPTKIKLFKDPKALAKASVQILKINRLDWTHHQRFDWNVNFLDVSTYQI